MSLRQAQPLGPAEHTVLGLLHLSPRHGYELAEWFAPAGEFGDVCQVQPSLLYSHLKRLESAGYLTSIIETQQTRPPRHIYRLTDAGLAEFWRWLEQPARRNREIRTEFLLKLYFSRQIAGHDTSKLLDTQLAVAREQLATQRLELERYPASGFARLVRQVRIAATQGTIAWLEEYRAEITGQFARSGAL